MSKYYVPKIEEFKVGFRYEFRGIDGWGRQLEWENRVENGKASKYAFFTEGEDAYEYLKPESAFRVKYLDAEDIEELGWIRSKLDENLWTIGERELDTDDYEYFTISGYDGYNDFGGKEFVNYFSGRIKNYNQLKDLMVMLGIVKT